jgi:hypothetical protein
VKVNGPMTPKMLTIPETEKARKSVSKAQRSGKFQKKSARNEIWALS